MIAKVEASQLVAVNSPWFGWDKPRKFYVIRDELANGKEFLNTYTKGGNIRLSGGCSVPITNDERLVRA